MLNVEGVLDLYSEVFGASENEAALEDILDNEDYYILTEDVEGQVVSTMTAFIARNAVGKGKPYMIIDNIATHPDFQGMGFARKLYAQAKAIAEERHCSKILIVSNRKFGVQDFYHSLGLESKTSEVFIERL